MGKCASLMSKAVISLVMEAMGNTALSFLLSSTSWVSWSTTKATLDLSESSSLTSCRPATLPKEGRVSTRAFTGALVLVFALALLRWAWATGFLAAAEVVDFEGSAANADPAKHMDKNNLPQHSAICFKALPHESRSLESNKEK